MGKENKRKQISIRGRESENLGISDSALRNIGFWYKPKDQVTIYARVDKESKKFLEDESKKYGVSLGFYLDSLIKKYMENIKA
jgi:hypothetical protein